MNTKSISLLAGWSGAALLLLSATAAGAQDAPAVTPAPATSAAPAPNPALNLTLTETMRRVAEESAKREDLRSGPPPRSPAKLPDNFRVSVSASDGVCWPGEERMMGLERARRANRSVRSR
jgi:hypothetical protein